MTHPEVRVAPGGTTCHRVDSTAPTLEVEGVSKRFGRTQVLHHISFSMRAGAVTVLLGPSGTGKTTLGEIIAGVVPLDAGRIHFDGVDITHARAEQRGIALAPQAWELFPHLSAKENVAFGLWAHRVPRGDRLRIATEYLRRAGLAGREDALPHQLSGGQQQRVALVRALAAPGRFVVLDEPFANVDQDTRQILRSLVEEEAARGKGILLITHDRNDALLLADTVVCLHGGSVAQVGTPEEIYRTPRSLSAARLTGEASLVPADHLLGPVVADTGDGEHGGPVGGDHAYGLILRPEWLKVVPDGDFHLEGTVTKVDYLGAEFVLTVDLGKTELLVYSKHNVAAGSAVRLAIDDGVIPPRVRLD